MEELITITIITITIIMIILIYQYYHIEAFNNNEAVANISSMYNNGALIASSINSPSGQIKFGSGITSESLTSKQLIASSICVTPTNCMQVEQIFDMIKFIQMQRMYLATECKIYQDVFSALSSNFISKIGNPVTTDYVTYSTNIWYSRKMLKFGDQNESAGNGILINVPAGHTVVWLCLRNDVWQRVHVIYADTKLSAGDFASGHRNSNTYSPDGSVPDTSSYFNWVPIALTRSSPVIINAAKGTDQNGAWIGGIATSTNPWNHITNSAVAYFWNVNGSSPNLSLVGTWHSDQWGNDILWQLNDNATYSFNVLVIPNSRDKLIYFITHNDVWNSEYFPGSITINGQLIERPVTTYTNPFATHFNTKPWSRYVAAKIPASVIGSSTNLNVVVSLNKSDNGNIYFREIGTHDALPL